MAAPRCRLGVGVEPDLAEVGNWALGWVSGFLGFLLRGPPARSLARGPPPLGLGAVDMFLYFLLGESPEPDLISYLPASLPGAEGLGRHF